MVARACIIIRYMEPLSHHALTKPDWNTTKLYKHCGWWHKGLFRSDLDAHQYRLGEDQKWLENNFDQRHDRSQSRGHAHPTRRS